MSEAKTKMNAAEKEMLEFYQTVADKFPALSEYFAHCQDAMPVRTFRTDKELMIASLSGEPDATLWLDIDNLLASGKKIEAIKLHRNVMKTSLKDAKYSVDGRIAELLEKGDKNCQYFFSNRIK